MTTITRSPSNELHDIVDALTAALDAKNEYTCGHSQRVANLSLALAQEMQLTSEEQQEIDMAAHLHDIGKIGIPDSVLVKPGRLTPEEFAVIRMHPEIGFTIVNKVYSLASVAKIIRHHHERMDGCGYPDGLDGEDIPLGSRIISICDAFDAMTSQRSYRACISWEQAVAEVSRCAGSQFDKDIVEVFRTVVMSLACTKAIAE
jgi:putative nucleotidyltransferase with HDIG domain